MLRYSTLSGTTSCLPGSADIPTARQWTPSTTTRFTLSKMQNKMPEGNGAAAVAAAPAPGRDPLLELAGLTISIPTESGTVEAVRGISLTVERGETLGIVR